MITAMKKARQALESRYDSVCHVTEYLPIKDSVTKRTATKETLVIDGQPCRVSFKSSPAGSSDGAAAAISQSIKLFIAPEIEIKPGSKIIVSRDGRTEGYKCSGVPAVYVTHQEVDLILFGGWA